MQQKYKHLGEFLGPICISALSFFLSFYLLEPLLRAYGGDAWSLFASRGAGKFAISALAIAHVMLLLTFCSKQRMHNVINQVFHFSSDPQWYKKFAAYFILSFILHAGFQSVCTLFSYAAWVLPNKNIASYGLILFLDVLIIPFLLAWSEEFIFRGVLYTYMTTYLGPRAGILTTSIIFMFVHNLTNPLALISSDAPLGFGLFLLGVLLNLLFVITGKLYVSIAVHMGLVAFKVLLRRLPFIVFLSKEQLPWWLDSDLRAAPLVHLFFILSITIFALKNKEKL